MTRKIHIIFFLLFVLLFTQNACAQYFIWREGNTTTESNLGPMMLAMSSSLMRGELHNWFDYSSKFNITKTEFTSLSAKFNKYLPKDFSKVARQVLTSPSNNNTDNYMKLFYGNITPKREIEIFSKVTIYFEITSYASGYIRAFITDIKVTSPEENVDVLKTDLVLQLSKEAAEFSAKYPPPADMPPPPIER